MLCVYFLAKYLVGVCGGGGGGGGVGGGVEIHAKGPPPPPVHSDSHAASFLL